MVRAFLRQCAGIAIQQRYDHLHPRVDRRSQRRLVVDAPKQSGAHRGALSRQCGHAGHSVLRQRLRHALVARRRCALRALVPPAVEEKRPICGAQARAQHLVALHVDAHDRLFVLRTHRVAFGTKHADGSKLTRRHLLARHLPEPRAVRSEAPSLWSSLYLASCGLRQGRKCAASREEKCQRARQVRHRRGERPARLPLCAENALPPYVLSRPCWSLPAMVGRYRHQTGGSARPIRRPSLRFHRRNAFAVGQPPLLPLLPGELHVLALLHVEFCRPSERHSKLRRTRTRPMDHRYSLH